MKQVRSYLISAQTLIEGLESADGSPKSGELDILWTLIESDQIEVLILVEEWELLRTYLYGKVNNRKHAEAILGDISKVIKVSSREKDKDLKLIEFSNISKATEDSTNFIEEVLIQHLSAPHETSLIVLESFISIAALWLTQIALEIKAESQDSKGSIDQGVSSLFNPKSQHGFTLQTFIRQELHLEGAALEESLNGVVNQPNILEALRDGNLLYHNSGETQLFPNILEPWGILLNVTQPSETSFSFLDQGRHLESDDVSSSTSIKSEAVKAADIESLMPSEGATPIVFISPGTSSNPVLGKAAIRNPENQDSQDTSASEGVQESPSLIAKEDEFLGEEAMREVSSTTDPIFMTDTDETSAEGDGADPTALNATDRHYKVYVVLYPYPQKTISSKHEFCLYPVPENSDGPSADGNADGNNAQTLNSIPVEFISLFILDAFDPELSDIAFQEILPEITIKFNSEAALPPFMHYMNEYGSVEGNHENDWINFFISNDRPDSSDDMGQVIGGDDVLFLASADGEGFLSEIIEDDILTSGVLVAPSLAQFADEAFDSATSFHTYDFESHNIVILGSYDTRCDVINCMESAQENDLIAHHSDSLVQLSPVHPGQDRV
ncbi:MAG: hypothetical protein F6J95_001960 [Leptolyngbya sp. SIO1E4]|nr:hypothetical protein [Leptolyngbya sp. SIO1E4]